MKTFVPRHSRKFLENPDTPTAKTDKTFPSPSFVSFGSDPLGVIQKNNKDEASDIPLSLDEGNFENTPNPSLTKLTKALEPLPWQLERLIKAASSGVLPVHMHGVPDTARYVLAWAASYLIGDREHCLPRLWEVCEQWQQSKN